MSVASSPSCSVWRCVLQKHIHQTFSNSGPPLITFQLYNQHTTMISKYEVSADTVAGLGLGFLALPCKNIFPEFPFTGTEVEAQTGVHLIITGFQEFDKLSQTIELITINLKIAVITFFHYCATYELYNLHPCQQEKDGIIKRHANITLLYCMICAMPLLAVSGTEKVVCFAHIFQAQQIDRNTQ